MSTQQESKKDFFDKLVSVTESVLTWRARRRFRRRERQKKKSWLVDWIEAFVWAACVVLIINQYFFQAYEIPSGSMERTLLVHDRIFVNKFIFGPELLPGLGKLPGLAQPQRGDIIIFENPAYISPVSAWGPAWVTAYDVAQRLLYMMTLSLVEIDRDPDGKPKAHFLVKRAVGYGGDVVRFIDGNAYFRPEGLSGWMPEHELKKLTGLVYGNHRVPQNLQDKYYQALPGYALALAHQDLGLPMTDADKTAVKTFNGVMQTAESSRQDFIYDPFALDQLKTKIELAYYPNIPQVTSDWQKDENGTYIPKGYLLPLGDNRDNSKDGRYFGPVRANKVLGEAAFRYWPLYRFGEIR